MCQFIFLYQQHNQFQEVTKNINTKEDDNKKTIINEEDIKYILDKMFIKRFNLSYDCDINKYENKESHISSILNTNYNHIACILKNKKCFKEGKHFILWYK